MLINIYLRYPGDKVIKRYVSAWFIIFISWAIFTIFSLGILRSATDLTQLMIPLEFFAISVSIILYTWVFSSDLSSLTNPGAIRFFVLSLCILGAVFGIIVIASLQATDDFNFWATLSMPLIILFLLGTTIIGFIVSLAKLSVIVDTPLKLVYYSLLISGFAYALILLSTDNSESYGVIRWAFMVSMFISLVVAYRVVLERLSVQTILTIAQENESFNLESLSVPVMPEIIEPIQAPPETESLLDEDDTMKQKSPIQDHSTQLLKAMSLILQAQDPEDLPARIVEVVLDLVNADIGALLRFQDANYADVEYAYDRRRQRVLAGMSLNLKSQPTIKRAFSSKKQQLVMAGDEDDTELADLFMRLDLNHHGPAYLQPLIKGGECKALLLIGFPYTKSALNGGQLDLLKGYGVLVARLLSFSDTAIEMASTAQERAIQEMVDDASRPNFEFKETAGSNQLEKDLQRARTENQRLVQQLTQLQLQLDDERTRLTSMLSDTKKGLSVSQQIVAIHTEQRRLRRDREELFRRLKEAEATLAGATSADSDDMTKQTIEALEREREELLSQRARYQQQLEGLQVQQSLAPESEEMQTMIQQMSAENDRLQSERDRMVSQMQKVESQLHTLGVTDGVSGLMALVTRLKETYLALRKKNETLQQDRALLLKERQDFETEMQLEKERNQQISMLQGHLNNLASDREAFANQLDDIRSENQALKGKIERVKEHRDSLLAKTSGYELEIEDSHQEQALLRNQMQALVEEKTVLTHRLEQLSLDHQTLDAEYHNLKRQASHISEHQPAENVNAVDTELRLRLDQLLEERNALQYQLNDTQAQLQNQLTELKQLQSQLMARSASFESNGSDPELILGLAEDLRTPMTSLVGYVDLLLGESAGIISSMQRKFLQRVSVNVSRLEAMIADLIHIAQLDAGKLNLQMDSFDLISVLEQSITVAGNQFREKRLAADLNFDENIPLFYVDRDAMGQVISQLLLNAYLVSPPNSQINVDAHMIEDFEPQIVVTVEDSGGGIDLEDLDQIFTRRYRADIPLVEGLGDTGVGMVVAQKLIECHGGRMWAESELGKGTRFSFSLPMNRV